MPLPTRSRREADRLAGAAADPCLPESQPQEAWRRLIPIIERLAETAAKARRCDEVRQKGWLDQLDTTLAAEGPDWSDEGAYDLLAGCARLERVRPEMLDQQQAGHLIRTAQQILAECGKQLAQLALAVPNPDSWLEAARDFERVYEEDIDPVALNTRAEGLLTELDDAELALYAAASQAVRDDELTKRLDACRDWLIENAYLFVPASVHIQAVGMTLRPDLFDIDYDLALTALKYEALLDALERAEAELLLEDIAPLPASVARELAERLAKPTAAAPVSEEAVFASGQSKPAPGFPASLLPPIGLAAAAAGRQQPAILRWNALGRHYFAVCAVPPAETETLTVSVFREDGQPATELAGTPVRLAGVAATLDQHGQARFRLEDIRKTRQDLRLELGREPTPWLPDE